MQPLLLPVVIYLILQLMKHNSISRCILLNAFQLFLHSLSFMLCCFVRTDSYFTVICFSFFLHSPRESGERRGEAVAPWGPLLGTWDHPSTLPGNAPRTLSLPLPAQAISALRRTHPAARALAGERAGMGFTCFQSLAGVA